MTTQNGVQAAGDVQIVDLTLITNTGVEIDLRSYMAELNLTEDIFSPAMYGNMLIVDAINMIEKGPIIGEEALRLNFVTPGTKANIAKTFRVYAISDRRLMLDDKKQGYIIHFCSQEVFVDVLARVHKTFEGTGDQIAEEIYRNYLATSRNIVNVNGTLQDSEKTSELTVLNETSNKIKFTSPGWGAMKCMSWLASKSITTGSKNADNLFFESSKQYYWGSVSSIFKAAKESKQVAGEFYYMPNNVLTMPASPLVDGVQYRVPSVLRAYKIMSDFEIVDSFNTLKSLQNGHLANRIITLDLINKKYEYHDFDYVDDFDKFDHLEKNAPFSKTAFRSAAANTEVYFKHPGLYTGFKGNFNENIEDIRQNRKSLLSGLSSFKIEGTIPGRTDFEAGTVVYFGMPKMQPMDSKDKSAIKLDEFYSGLYLITCIRHKLFGGKHQISMELVKDSVGKSYD